MAGSLRLSGNQFHIAGSATEKPQFFPRPGRVCTHCIPLASPMAAGHNVLAVIDRLIARPFLLVQNWRRRVSFDASTVCCEKGTFCAAGGGA